MLDQSSQNWQAVCPNPTEVCGIAATDGHEKSLLGKRARLESESHTQDEYVTEVDKARRLLSNLSPPIIIDIPTVTNEVWRRARSG